MEIKDLSALEYVTVIIPKLRLDNDMAQMLEIGKTVAISDADKTYFFPDYVTREIDVITDDDNILVTCFKSFAETHMPHLERVSGAPDKNGE